MKHLFLINPAAGACDRTVQIKSAAETILGGRGLDYAIQLSKAPGHCIELAKAAAAAGEKLRIYACGGDGTLNEAVNGAAGFENVSVTHFPSGSGNDFVKIFSEPEAFRNLERLLDCEEADFDLIACRTGGKTSYSLNICSLGLDARIGTDISSFRRLPLVNGSGAYILSTAVNLCKGIHRPYTVEMADQRITGEQTMICVCNGQYYGGSFHPVPDAVPDDGLLDILLVKPVNLLQVAAVIGKYQKGKYAQCPNLIRHFRTDWVKISCEQESVINLDGEARFGTEVELSIAPQKLRFFYPRGLQYLSKKSKSEKIGAI